MVHIRRLREKIEDDPSHPAVPGDGAGAGLPVGEGESAMRVREFFKLSLLVVLAAVLIVGIALAGLLAFIGVTAHKQQTWNLSIGEISEALVEDESAPGEYHFSMQQVLDEDPAVGDADRSGRRDSVGI